MHINNDCLLPYSAIDLVVVVVLLILEVVEVKDVELQMNDSQVEN